MISYSTGDSGSGAEVEKVREATRIAHEKRPDLLIDGPLQYDAAANESVGRQARTARWPAAPRCSCSPT
jgi:phosphate acetyltransferase